MPRKNSNKNNQPVITALIPARGGSKSVPKKNIRTVGNIPLIAWAIETAKSTPEVGEIFTTTDDEEIAAVGREYGASVIDRPPELAADDSLPIDVIKHAIDWLTNNSQRPDWIVYLEPTCPFRAVEDVRACLNRLEEGYDSAATFVEAEVNPHRTWTIDGDEPEPFVDEANPWVPRQQTPDAYQLTGGCYAFSTDIAEKEDGPGLLFGQGAAVRVPRERSVDIDYPIDLRVAQILADEKNLHPGN